VVRDVRFKHRFKFSVFRLNAHKNLAVPLFRKRLTWCPEHHSPFLCHFSGQIFNRSTFDASCHTMLDTRWLEPFVNAVCALGTEFCGKRYEGKIHFTRWQLLNHFDYLHSCHPCRPPVFLGTSNLTRIATRAIFVIYQ